jgi:hypothetical protein
MSNWTKLAFDLEASALRVEGRSLDDTLCFPHGNVQYPRRPRGSAMSGTSRYDRDRPVEPEHLAEARAFHLIAHLLDDYPGITNSAVAGKVGQVLHTAANELSNGRADPPQLRNAVRGLANALREDMQPPPDHLHGGV